MSLLMRKGEQEVFADITIIPQGILIGENTIAQFHIISISIRGLGWMRYEDK
jgi:hypothetical protein